MFLALKPTFISKYDSIIFPKMAFPVKISQKGEFKFWNEKIFKFEIYIRFIIKKSWGSITQNVQI